MSIIPRFGRFSRLAKPLLLALTLSEFSVSHVIINSITFRHLLMLKLLLYDYLLLLWSHFHTFRVPCDTFAVGWLSMSIIALWIDLAFGFSRSSLMLIWILWYCSLLFLSLFRLQNLMLAFVLLLVCWLFLFLYRANMVVFVIFEGSCHCLSRLRCCSFRFILRFLFRRLLRLYLPEEPVEFFDTSNHISFLYFFKRVRHRLVVCFCDIFTFFQSHSFKLFKEHVALIQHLLELVSDFLILVWLHYVFNFLFDTIRELMVDYLASELRQYSRGKCLIQFHYHQIHPL